MFFQGFTTPVQQIIKDNVILIGSVLTEECQINLLHQGLPAPTLMCVGLGRRQYRHHRDNIHFSVWGQSEINLTNLLLPGTKQAPGLMGLIIFVGTLEATFLSSKLCHNTNIHGSTKAMCFLAQFGDISNHQFAILTTGPLSWCHKK